MELKALIFDVDGTLADNERDGHRVAFNQAFEARGLDWHWDVSAYGRLLEVFGGKERLKHFIENTLPAAERPDDVDAFVAEVHADKTRRYTELLEQGTIPLRPGVERLLREARAAGLALAVASTTTPQNVTTLMRANLDADGEDFFDVISAGDMVENKKPAPDVYERALDELGLPPEACLVFEDTHLGMISARNAGLDAIITVNEYTQDEDFSGALLVLDHLGEPDRPFTVLDGDSGGARWVDVDLLRGLHAARHG
ncbi:MAG: HAD-IA family hydrolase [Xanthomonadales bacterium]